MKIGDLVKKRWGKIEPEEKAAGLLISMTDTSSKGWPLVTVLYSFGERVFNKDDVEIINESR